MRELVGSNNSHILRAHHESQRDTIYKEDRVDEVPYELRPNILGRAKCSTECRANLQFHGNRGILTRYHGNNVETKGRGGQGLPSSSS